MNVTSEDYLIDFYGPSAQWFSIYVAVASVLGVIGNTFFICITLTSESLRIKSSNWLLVGFATTDLIHVGVHLYDAYAIRFGSIDNREPCWLAGIFVNFTSPISWGFPGLIAADRYYKIIITDYGKFSLGKTLFSNRFIIPLMIGWCCLSSANTVIMSLYDTSGEDPGGFCGNKKFTDIHMLLLYEINMLIFFLSLILSAFFYVRLGNWLKQHQRSASEDVIRATRDIMRYSSIVTIIPVVVCSPGTFLSSCQKFLPVISMELKRILTAPYWLSSIANPWLTIILVRPFRHRVLDLLRKAGVLAEPRTNRIVHMSTTI
uniref:G-protein coupled receptors family 1 profile domain-containing protein n=1 Tax=Plectus sambesii TaxID=2011161 RepID=A0A914WM04_9BILA